MALGQVKDRAAAWVAWSMLAIFVVGCGAAVTLEVTARGLGPGNVAPNAGLNRVHGCRRGGRCSPAR